MNATFSPVSEGSRRSRCLVCEQPFVEGLPPSYDSRALHPGRQSIKGSWQQKSPTPFSEGGYRATGGWGLVVPQKPPSSSDTQVCQHICQHLCQQQTGCFTYSIYETYFTCPSGRKSKETVWKGEAIQKKFLTVSFKAGQSDLFSASGASW